MKHFVKEIVAIICGFFITFLFIEPFISQDNDFRNNGLFAFCTLLTFFYCSGLFYALFIKITEARDEYNKKKEAEEKLKLIVANTVIVQNPDPYDISVGFACDQVNDIV